jgi:hypothetical protein
MRAYHCLARPKGATGRQQSVQRRFSSLPYHVELRDAPSPKIAIVLCPSCSQAVASQSHFLLFRLQEDRVRHGAFVLILIQLTFVCRNNLSAPSTLSPSLIFQLAGLFFLGLTVRYPHDPTTQRLSRNSLGEKDRAELLSSEESHYLLTNTIPGSATI